MSDTSQLQTKLREVRGTWVSCQTIPIHLHKRGLNARPPAMAPDHNARHMHHRHQLLNWSRAEWYSVLFLDENSFNLTITDEQKRCWRHQEECYTPIAKSPDGHLGVVGVMVWKSSLLASELISTKWMALWQSSTSSVTSLTPLSYPCISYTGLNSSSWMTRLQLTMFVSSLHNYGRQEWLKWTGLHLP